MARHRGKRAKGGTRTRTRQQKDSSSSYFTQPGKRGAVIVLRKPCGNRISPKVCGTMPSRVHAKMLITQLEKAESVVKDLFLEATDDGIEALEAVLAACREEVLRRAPAPARASGEVESEAEHATMSPDRSEDPAA
jgi:hypothetical protein